MVWCWLVLKKKESMASRKAARQLVCGNQKQAFVCAIPLRVLDTSFSVSNETWIGRQHSDVSKQQALKGTRHVLYHVGDCERGVASATLSVLNREKNVLRGQVNAKLAEIWSCIIQVHRVSHQSCGRSSVCLHLTRITLL